MWTNPEHLLFVAVPVGFPALPGPLMAVHREGGRVYSRLWERRGAGEMARWVRAPAVQVWVLSSSPGTTQKAEYDLVLAFTTALWRGGD